MNEEEIHLLRERENPRNAAVRREAVSMPGPSLLDSLPSPSHNRRVIAYSGRGLAIRRIDIESWRATALYTRR